jgi:Ca-activated chloride channel family protein
MIEDGTAIGSAVTMGVNRLRDLKAKSRVLVLLTDGVNNTGKISPALAAEAAATFQTKIYTVVAGNDQFIPVDEDILKEMAKKTGGKFYRAADTHQLHEIYGEIDRLEKSEVTMDTYSERRELFGFFVGIALLLALLEYLLRRTIFRILP